MRTLLSGLSSILLLVTVFAWSLPSFEKEQQSLVLPLEVMHYDVFGEIEGNSELPFYGGNSPRYVKSVTFDVSGSPGELWLWGHQIGFQYFWDHFEWQQGAGDLLHEAGDYTINSDYDAPFDGRAKAAVRINGGSWVDITNDSVTCAEPEESEFCVGGMAGATRLKINDSQLQSGSNTVEFAFLGHDMLSSGYRVIDIAALPAGYSGSLSHRDVREVDLITNNKVMDHLDTEAPTGSDPVAGEALWNERNSLLDHPGGPEIIASCNDCHAHDGRDLEFFGYSNESIVVRSRHHGLTQQEGENIAAYIRSQELTYEDGTPYEWRSRPWNPPYQPGPAGFGPNDEHPDVANQQYWAGGAGLEWVADSDNEALPYLFSDGTGNPQAGPFVDPPNLAIQSDLLRVDNPTALNLRAIPIDVQFPDWNRWLPIIHPLDGVGDVFYSAEHRGWTTKDAYMDARNAGTDISPTQMSRQYGTAWNSIRSASITDENTAWNRVRSRYARGLTQWGAVKQWELHHEFFASDRSDDPTREERSWITENRPVFNIASHISGSTTTLDGPPQWGAGQGFSHLWYHVQLILSASEDNRSGQSPIDWNYQQMYLRAFTGNTGLPSAVRSITTIAKKDQMLGTKHGLDPMTGFNNHRHGLRGIYRDASSLAFSGLDDALRSEVVGAYLSAWISWVREWDIEDWPRKDDGVQIDRNYWGLPTDNPTLGDGTPTNAGGNNAARNHYRSIHWFDNNLDIAASTLDSLAHWGRDMWSDPESGNPPWETWIIGEGVAGDFTLERTSGSSIQVQPGQFEFTASDFAVEVTDVTFFVDGVAEVTLTAEPYVWTWNDVPPGDYEITAEATPEDPELDPASSNPQFVVVTEEWNNSRLAERIRGNAVGLINRIQDMRVEIEATGFARGAYRRGQLEQVEAEEECLLGDSITFTLDDCEPAPGRAWSRCGFRVDNHDEWIAWDYFPLQRRARLTHAIGEGFPAEIRTYRNLDPGATVKFHIEGGGPINILEIKVDRDSDGVFDHVNEVTIGGTPSDPFDDDPPSQECTWGFTTTSRTDDASAYGLFTVIERK